MNNFDPGSFLSFLEPPVWIDLGVFLRPEVAGAAARPRYTGEPFSGYEVFEMV